MRQAARGLRRLGVSFDTILTSPFVRARQTAEIVAESLGLEDRLEEISELTPENSVDHAYFRSRSVFRIGNIYSSSAITPS